MKPRLMIPVGWALATAAVLLGLAGCERPSGGPAPARQDGGPRVFTIGMSQCNLGEPWRVQMNADIRAAAARHPELRVIFKDAQYDTLRQRAHVEEFINARVDLLIISPKEAAPLTEPVARALNAGIPVIVLDRAVLGERFIRFIGADNVKIGRSAGEWIKRRLGGRGRAGGIEGADDVHPGPGPASGLSRGHRRHGHRGDF